MARVELPFSLRSAAGGRAWVEGEGSTVALVLASVVAQCPALGEALLTRDGQLKRSFAVFIGENDVRGLGGLEAPVKREDVLVLVTAIAGG